MNLRRQLLLVSLLTLVLPWAGCQFIRETETALREGQQQMLAGTAQAIADSLAQFPAEFLATRDEGVFGATQLYAHPLEREPLLDGYFSDWSVTASSLQTLRGIDGPARYVLGLWRQQLWLYAEIRDDEVRYASGADAFDADADRITLVSAGEDGRTTEFIFVAEAPGQLVARRGDGRIEPRIAAHWQDTPAGYQLEARIPRQVPGPMLGLTVHNAGTARNVVRNSTFDGARPGRLVTPSPVLQSVLRGYVQDGLRLVVTNRSGWRLALAGSLSGGGRGSGAADVGWLRYAYDAILEPAEETALAEPSASGREQQGYIGQALNGDAATSWFRSPETGRAVVAVAQPVWSGTVQTGAVVLQQGTDAILSLTSDALTRLMNFTLLATLVAAGALLGYATWLSQRVRRLSRGARRALDDDRVSADLPSLSASDEIGDLSRSFSSVLGKLGAYNDYLRTLASRLSHELRTPLTIVRSSLENLEHEPLSAEGRRYTERARDGVDRLKRILNAMSEASRVEELIGNAEPEHFDLDRVLQSTIAAYADAWPEHRFRYDGRAADARLRGAPELLIQMLDKLIDNAVDFTQPGDEIVVTLDAGDDHLSLAVTNAGPPLPEKMRTQLFDSLISVRPGDGGQHLGFGLFVARLIAEGHGGRIVADNVEGGVRFEVRLKRNS
ncbi:MAG: ATP-binding protein [Woeseiaceae bacterium]|nr:ATP-binding protein [Woeseiaceae bacterium]